MKVRAWLSDPNFKQNEQMIYGDLLDKKSMYEFWCNYHGWTGSIRKMMQYTGLRDIKRTEKFPTGQLICDGDMVKATNKNGWTRLFKIMWIDDRAKFMVWESSQPNISFDLTCDTILDFRVEVIGNEYQNPELLGGK